MWNLFDVPRDVPIDEYIQQKKDQATVDFRTEIGAAFDEGLEWNLSYRAARWGTTYGRGDYMVTAEGAFEETEFQEEYERQRNTKVSQEEWTERTKGKDEIKGLWSPSMNKLDADYLIKREEERRVRDWIYEHKKGGWRTGVGLMAGFAAQAADPLIYIPIFGHGTKLSSIGKAFGLSRLVKARPLIAGFTVNALDALVGTALSDLAIIPWMHSEGDDTPWSMMAWDAMFSLGAAGVLTAATHGMNRFGKWTEGRADASIADQTAYKETVRDTIGPDVSEAEFKRTSDEYDAWIKDKGEDPVPEESILREQETQAEINDRKIDITEEGVDRTIQDEFDARTEADFEELTARREAGDLDTETAASVTELEELRSRTEAREAAYDDVFKC